MKIRLLNGKEAIIDDIYSNIVNHYGPWTQDHTGDVISEQMGYLKNFIWMLSERNITTVREFELLIASLDITRN